MGLGISVGVAGGVGPAVGGVSVGAGGDAGGSVGRAVAAWLGSGVGIAVGWSVGAAVGWAATAIGVAITGGVAVGAAVSNAAGGAGRLNTQAARKMTATRPAPTATIICCRKVSVCRKVRRRPQWQWSPFCGRRGGMMWDYQDCGATAGRVSVKAVCWPAAGAGTDATVSVPP